MRLFEISIATGLLAAFINFALPQRRRPLQPVVLSAAIVLFTVLHLFIERYRWQMVPIYALLGVVVAVAVTLRALRPDLAPPGRQTKMKNVARIAASGIGILYLAAATGIAVLFPVASVPAPTGPFAVGTTSMHFTDTSRFETLTEDPTDRREFNVKIWYPADDRGKRASYQETARAVGSITAESSVDIGGGTPDFVFGHVSLIRSHSTLDVPLSNRQATYPVLFFSPGFLASFDNCQVYTEELASHGYIVVSPDQPYESRSVIHADGSSTPFSRAHAKAFHDDMESTLPLWIPFWETTDLLERREIARKILSGEHFMDNVLRIRAADIAFVVDELLRDNTDGMFGGRLDLSRLGVFGHSMGGAVAGQVVLTDPRFKAAVNLDGFQFGDMVKREMTRPLMMVYSEAFADANEFVTQQYASGSVVFTIRGSTHGNFCDDTYIFPIMRRLGMAGPIPTLRMAEIVRHYLRAFFDAQLRGTKEPLLTGPSSDFPEVEFATDVR